MMLGGGGVRRTGVIVRGQAQVMARLEPDVVRLTRMISRRIEVLRGMGSHGYNRGANVGRYRRLGKGLQEQPTASAELLLSGATGEIRHRAHLANPSRKLERADNLTL